MENTFLKGNKMLIIKSIKFQNPLTTEQLALLSEVLDSLCKMCFTHSPLTASVSVGKFEGEVCINLKVEGGFTPGHIRFDLTLKNLPIVIAPFAKTCEVVFKRSKYEFRIYIT